MGLHTGTFKTDSTEFEKKKTEIFVRIYESIQVVCD